MKNSMDIQVMNAAEGAAAGTTAGVHTGRDGDHDHGSMTGVTLKVFAALCVLTCASLLTYTPYWQQYVPMEIGRAVMLVVSIVKAFLVVTFFMHMFWEAKWKYVVIFPALTVSILLGLALIPDIGKRTEQYDSARLLAAPEPMPYAVGGELQVAQPPAGAKEEHGGTAGHEKKSGSEASH
ncbi:MAG: cytochrome C oxidase subunit IV family protein [Pirellulales bacterium]